MDCSCKLYPMRGCHGRGWLIRLFLVAAMFGLVGHVCVIPLHSHAVPLEGHGSHDDDSADHSVHTASCEAARGGITIAALLPIPQPVDLPTVPAPSYRPFSPAPDVPTAESPPLFLLHASLLI